ncbi:unnamed protein product [Enterobius vermicularis]|uniref:G_PROTEIN_RECEP_F1_2 domain-containing protein n=1 Tax=Enterobius vermicularis TaxID=51028 RepID=A0A0N4VP31_ENTVE|nr:unnamed protein product [Enterobius vermicularis]
MVRAVKYIRRRVGDRNLHLFLLNMTFADLILTGWAYPNEWMLYFLDRGSVPNPYKYSMHVVAWIALSVSALSLVLLNVDKLIYFLYRLQ